MGCCGVQTNSPSDTAPGLSQPHHVEGGFSVNGQPYFLDAGTGAITQLSLWKRFHS